MPNAPKTPHRTVRVPDDLWQAAQERAAQEGQTMTEVVIGCLRRYVAAGRRRRTPAQPEPDPQP